LRKKACQLSMEQIFRVFNQYTHLSLDTIELLNRQLTFKKIKANEVLLKQGSTCKSMFFLQKGIVRGYYEKDGKSVTNWFAVDNDIVTSLSSFIAQKPSYESIETLTDCELYHISYPALQDIYKISPEMNTIGRLLTEQYYVILEERVIALQFYTAKERYDAFMLRYPQLLQKIPLGIIASYLGVTQSSLSRIRKKP
jgi:CRP-like cAMP-binding protein